MLQISVCNALLYGMFTPALICYDSKQNMPSPHEHDSPLLSHPLMRGWIGNNATVVISLLTIDFPQLALTCSGRSHCGVNSSSVLLESFSQLSPHRHSRQQLATLQFDRPQSHHRPSTNFSTLQFSNPLVSTFGAGATSRALATPHSLTGLST